LVFAESVDRSHDVGGVVGDLAIDDRELGAELACFPASGWDRCNARIGRILGQQVVAGFGRIIHVRIVDGVERLGVAAEIVEHDVETDDVRRTRNAGVGADPFPEKIGIILRLRRVEIGRGADAGA
jgi:hypothetical protein